MSTAAAIPTSPPPAASRGSREVDLLLVIYVAVIVFSILYPVSFFSAANAQAVLRNLAVDGILAIGMMTLLVAGVFDLSVGAMLSLAGVVVGWLLVERQWPVPAAVAAGLLTGAAGGLANGLLVTRAKVNALITTLATMGVFRGLAVLLGGTSIANLPERFTRLGQAEWVGIQAPVWLMLGLAVVGHYLLAHTRWFRQLYYIGANPKAAVLSGIPAARMQAVAFTLMGLIAALAGIAFASRVGTAVSTAGDGAELRVITAVILGGASLNGGRGTIAGALIGVVFMSLVNNLLIIAKVSTYWQSIVVGVILILAVALDSLKNRGQRT
jgi:ribose/xylose/arabinose/galactoside ABC-type transport system permease subunit